MANLGLPLWCRGYKVVLRFFPNEVACFEPVVGMLGKLNQVVRTKLSTRQCSTAAFLPTHLRAGSFRILQDGSLG